MVEFEMYPWGGIKSSINKYIDLEVYQAEIWNWAEYNFGDAVECPLEFAALGLAEECGEALRAILKKKQGIRGTDEEWDAELKKELGDVFIKVIEVGARAGFDMAAVISERWNSIRQRDWRADRLGHGIEGS